jgi:hypothetical protein
MSIYTICFLSFVHYVYMYRLHDVYTYLFLFCIHVVVGVDDFFVLCYFSQSSLVVEMHSHFIPCLWENV